MRRALHCHGSSASTARAAAPGLATPPGAAADGRAGAAHLPQTGGGRHAAGGRPPGVRGGWAAQPAAGGAADSLQPGVCAGVLPAVDGVGDVTFLKRFVDKIRVHSSSPDTSLGR